ncbi:hypothetical protein CMEL01_13052 [Colletotrichum melonis]|uniref:2EXR domain-containing protein n=1 Tax=Colletotrichum melonis TaxID=1209925 RepID=A0AAI9XUH6_9PEZI|nr:hypothetical protein CMEL01_13052 [Colletotrichum melonis]
MDELQQLIKSLTESLDAMAKAHTQQSKTISELVRLHGAKETSTATATRVKDLADNQELMAGMMNIHINAMKQQATMVLSKQRAAAMFFQQQELIPPLTAGFPQFCRLPMELRKIIWQMTLPDSRVFEPYDIEHRPRLRKRFEPPAILAVCKESRKVANEHGTFIFGWEKSIGESVWFNPKKDVVIMEDAQIFVGLWPALLKSQVEILAFHWTYFRSHEQVEDLWDCIRDVPSCRRVIILYRSPSNYIYSDEKVPKLFSLKPSDIVLGSAMEWMSFDDFERVEEGITWEEFKREMEDLWRRRHVGKDEAFPPLEGMELIMCKEDRTFHG